MHTVNDRQSVSDYPAPAKSTSGTPGSKYTLVGFVCALVALVFLPIVFGPVGAVFGFIGYAKGDKRGLWVGIGAIAATFIGFLLGALVFHAVHHTQTPR